MRKRVWWWVAVSQFLIAFVPIAAAQEGRVRVDAVADEKVVAGAEVCFQPGRPGNVLSEHLVTDETRCYPAGTVLRVPAGFWNYYTIYSNRLVSTHPGRLVVRGGGSEEPLVTSSRLVPAATLDFSHIAGRLGAGEFFAVYFSNAERPESRPVYRPVPRGTMSMLVPAGTRVYPLRANEEQITWVGAPLSGKAGEQLQVGEKADAATVAAIVMIPETIKPEERARTEGTKAPEVRLRDGAGWTVAPVEPLRPTAALDGSLVVFERVAPGPYVLQLAGELWRSDEIAVDVPKDGFVMAKRFLITEPRSKVAIRWRVDPDFATRPMPLARCGDAAPAMEPAVVSLHRCPFGYRRGNERQCEPVATFHPDTQAAAAGTFEVPRLESGDYYAELLVRGLRVRETVKVDIGRTAAIDLAMMPVRIRGRVLLGETPVAAEVRFAGGGGISDAATGEYEAFTPVEPLQRPVTVRLCEQGVTYRVVPDRPIHANASYDVVIPDNLLTVRVVDAQERRPLANASVTIAAGAPEDPDTVLFEQVQAATGGDGVVETRHLSPSFVYNVCARSAGYEPLCRSVVDVSEQTDTLELPLERSRAVSVRIASPFPLDHARLLATRGFDILQNVEIVEGVARIDASTPPDALLYVTGQRHPLSMLRMPIVTAAVVDIAVPKAAVVTSEVHIAAGNAHPGGPLGLSIGGTIVPSEVFAVHQRYGLQRSQLLPGQQVVVHDVLATAPVQVLLWYLAPLSPVRMDAPGDPFAHPEIARLAYRQPLGARRSLELAPPPWPSVP